METVNEKIDAMFKLREEIRKHEAKIKELTDQKSEIELLLLKQMDEQGLERAAGAKASVTVSESIKPSVEDWDLFYKYIHRMKMYHLLERRPSVSGCRELFEKRGKIPGVVPFKQRQVQMRTNK